jgi:hypothetical protein
MIRIALSVVFADSKKHAKAGTDSGDRLASDVNFGAGYSLDDSSHDELAGKKVIFFSSSIKRILWRSIAVKRRRPSPFVTGFLYVVTKKFIVDNPADHWRETRQNPYSMLCLSLPGMKTRDHLWSALIVLTCALGWATYSVAATIEQYRSEGSAAKDKGSVIGTVWLAGTHQRPARLRVFKNRDFCGPWVANESLLVNPDGGIQNTAIVLRPLDGQARVRPASIVLDNRSCVFTPHVQVAPIGSELRLKNSDPILHTVHARIGRETLFNVGLPRWRQVAKILTRSGIIRINCDVLHTWMSAAIVVTTSPYYAVTDQYGRFAIERLPAGEYEMDAWHEKLGTKNHRLFVSEGAQISVDVVYRSN